MAQDIFIRVRRCPRPSTVHRRDTLGNPNGEKHAGGIARNQDRATEAAGPKETLQRSHKPVIEARLPSKPNRRRLVRDRSRWQRRKLDEEICAGRRLRGVRHVLDYWQAQKQARVLARGGQDGENAYNRPATVAEALDAYEKDLAARGGMTSYPKRLRKVLPPALLAKPVALLAAREHSN